MNKTYEDSEREYLRAQKYIPEGIKGMHKIADVHKYPCYYTKSDGCTLWDLDGNSYIDYVMGKGPYILGYRNKKVENAVIEQIKKGNVYPMGNVLHTNLAEKIVNVVPTAEKVLFYKTGSCAASAAVRLARVFTGKNMVVSSGYHGWHDWCNPGRGVLKEVTEQVFEFDYNLNVLESFLGKYACLCCCVIISPECSYFTKSYYQKLESICKKYKVLFILDEVKTGFRVSVGGFQQKYHLYPDLSIFSKAIANGYSLSVVCGNAEIMECNKEIHTAGTYDTETIAFAAANVVIDYLSETDCLQRIHENTTYFVDSANTVFRTCNVDIHCIGEFGSFRFWFRDSEFETDFYNKIAQNGILFYPYDNSFICSAHTTKIIQETCRIMETVLMTDFKERQTGFLPFSLEDISSINHKKGFLRNYPGERGV